MENDNTDIEQSQNDEMEETTTEETQEQSEDSVDYKSLYEAELERKKLRRQRFAEKAKNEPVKPIINNSDAKWRERLELKVDGHDDEAIEFILKNGGKKALDNPYVAKALEGIKEQRLAEKAVIDEGSKSTSEKRINQKEFSRLTAAEQEKILSEL